MIPYSYQEELSNDGLALLREHAICYLAMEERTGKTLTAILIAEKADIKRVLVITKKNALPGWHETLEQFEHTKSYVVTNYHQAHKEDPDGFDLIMFDESHNYISGYPKPSKMWKQMSILAKDKPLIYLSATPYAQGPVLLYHQLKLSSWSPWLRYSNFYEWFKSFGIPESIWINSKEVMQYKTVKDSMVLGCCDYLFISKTRKELEFEQEPEDELHYITLSNETRDVYNLLLEDKYYQFADEDELICDSVMKLRTSLHMLEGGVAKTELGYKTLGNSEKLDYVKKTWPDLSKVAIMYQYIQEGVRLRETFPEALILQGTSNAEGIDLHHVDSLIVYSQDFSTARHTQRRARQANKNRTTPIIVSFLLVDKGISEQVYSTVSINKRNYVDSVFSKEYL